MKVLKYCIFIITFFSVVSCSNLEVTLTSYDDLLKAETQQNGKACVRQNNIRGYGVIENDVISVNARG